MKNCEMILAGFGGQGILFTGKILAFAAMLKDKKLSWLPSYGPEMRGGTANCHVIIDDEPIGSPIVTRPNILVAMNKPSLDKFENTVSDGGYVFINTSLIDRKSEREDVNEICVNATETAHNMGNKSLANIEYMIQLLLEFHPDDRQFALIFDDMHLIHNEEIFAGKQA